MAWHIYFHRAQSSQSPDTSSRKSTEWGGLLYSGLPRLPPPARLRPIEGRSWAFTLHCCEGDDARDAHVGPGATERGAASTAHSVERHAVARARERLRSRVAVCSANRVGARGASSIANREIGGEARLGGQRVALVYGQCVSGAPRKERTRLPVQRAIARERSEGRERRAASSPTAPADAPLGCYAPRTA